MGQYFDFIGVERLSDDNTFRVTCPYCGQTNEYYTWDRRDDGMVYCTNCGSLVDTSQPASAAPQRRPAADTWGDSTSSSGFAPAPASPWTPPQKKSSGVNTGLIICIAIIAFLFIPWYIGLPIIACLYCYWSRNRQPRSPSRRTPQTW